MKKINNIFLFTTVFFILVSVFSSCKKGENDPFFSIKSRKARLVGDWVISEGTVDNNGNYLSGNNTSSWQIKYKYSINELHFNGFDNNMNNNIQSIDTIQEIYTYSEKIEFKKDYTFEVEINVTIKSVKGVAVTQPTNSVYKYEGNWSFGSKNKEKDLKNKEYLVLQFTNSNMVETQGTQTWNINRTFSGFAFSDVFSATGSPVAYLVLDKLSNKEMVIKIEESEKTNKVIGTDRRSESYSFKGTKTYKKG